MKELGVNTLRLYNANPVTRQASIQQLGTNGISEPLGKNHIPFMDMAAEYGFKVIFPLIGDQTIMTTSTTEVFEQLLRNQIDEVGNHSALLMWNFSNELPLSGDPTLVATLNRYISYIRNYTMLKWERSVPITAAVVDIPTSYNTLVATLDVDVFSSNAGYRGLNFQDLWTGNPGEAFAGFKNLSAAYNKPLFISEMGWHQINNSVTEAIPNWFNQQWEDLVNHIDDGCIGGAFFEYSDEIYTKADALQQDMGVVSLSVNVETGGEKSDQQNVFIADIATRKAIIFAALQNGTFLNKTYNFNGDVFTLIGRQQSSLASCIVPPPPPSTTPTTTGSTTQSVTSGESSSSSSPLSSSSSSTSSSSPQNPSTTTTTTTNSIPWLNSAQETTAVYAYIMLALYLVLAM